MSPPAQKARPGAGLTQNGADPAILAPVGQLSAEGPDHGVGERVECLLPVEHHDAEPAMPLEADVHRHPASSRRAMITRMISLVPSRI